MIDRLSTVKVKEMATYFKVVAIIGPRQSGKTTLVRSVFPEKPYVSLEDVDTRRDATEDPRGFLTQYSKGAIFDEVQRVPELFSYLQQVVDETPGLGKFILTGSNNFLLQEKITQSLAGRVGYLELLPFSVKELKDLTAAETEEQIIKGFYPPVYDQKTPPELWYRNYVRTYLERDVRQMTQVADLAAFEKFLQMCAGRCGQLLNLSAMSNELGLTHPTIRRWVSILEASHIVKLLQPWHANVGKRLVKTPKLYFIDTGLACHLLGIERVEQVRTHPLGGALFENMIVAEALKQRFNAGRTDNLFFYRDHAGNEVDLLLSHAEGVSGYEIKSSRTVQPDFFRGLDRMEGDLGGLQGRAIVYGGDDARVERKTRIVPWSGFRIGRYDED